jgi:predicted CoA-binding protein
MTETIEIVESCAVPWASNVATAGAYERLRLLTEHNTIAMVGLSADPMRPSHFAAIYMQSHGYDIIPVNPKFAGTEILGQTVYASLSDIPKERNVEIVDVFRRPVDIPPILDAVASRARAAGMEVVQNRCVKIEHARFFGGLNLVGMNTGVITSRRRID